jgi:hypothetical protein
MNGIRKTLAEQITEDEKKIEQLKASLANKRAEQKTLDRKLDVRRKIVTGAVVKAHARLHSGFDEELRKAMLAGTRPQDRGLFPEYFPAADPIPPARPCHPAESQPTNAFQPLPQPQPAPPPPSRESKPPDAASNNALRAASRPQSSAVLPNPARATEPGSPLRPSRAPGASPSGAGPV